MAVRSKVKKEMEQAELMGDMFTYNVCDAKQAAIKVICNSAYGFTGAKAGLFGCIPIAITTCMIGRLKIMFSMFLSIRAILPQINLFVYAFFIQ